MGANRRFAPNLEPFSVRLTLLILVLPVFVLDCLAAPRTELPFFLHLLSGRFEGTVFGFHFWELSCAGCGEIAGDLVAEEKGGILAFAFIGKLDGLFFGEPIFGYGYFFSDLRLNTFVGFFFLIAEANFCGLRIGHCGDA